VAVEILWQSTQPQENQPNNLPPQGSSSQPSAGQQKAPEQSATPIQSPAAATAPCTENSQAASGVKSDCKPAATPANKTRKRHHKALAPAATGPRKTVVRNGGTTDPTVDLSPGLSRQQASHQIDSTNQLLAASNENLKKISGRALSANQQDTVTQIKSYMEQAKEAENDGDVQRAYNLALKANLLSAELAGK
jgi:hypothetical protein